MWGEVGWAGVQSTLSPAGAPKSRAHCHGAIYSPSSAAPPPPRPSHTAAFSPRPTALPWVRGSAASAAARCCLLHALAYLPCWLVPTVGVHARSQQAASFLIFSASPRASDKAPKKSRDLTRTRFPRPGENAYITAFESQRHIKSGFKLQASYNGSPSGATWDRDPDGFVLRVFFVFLRGICYK